HARISCRHVRDQVRGCLGNPVGGAGRPVVGVGVAALTDVNLVAVPGQVTFPAPFRGGGRIDRRQQREPVPPVVGGQGACSTPAANRCGGGDPRDRSPRSDQVSLFSCDRGGIAGWVWATAKTDWPNGGRQRRSSRLATGTISRSYPRRRVPLWGNEP